MAKRSAVAECARYAGLSPRDPVSCGRSKYPGRVVPLSRRHGGGEALVVGCAVPEFPKGCGPVDLVLRKGSGAFVFEPYRRVKDRVHETNREGLCKHRLHADGTGLLARELAKSKPPFAGGDLPFPHRRGSSVCCRENLLHPDRLAASLEDLRQGRGIMTLRDLTELADKGMPRAVAERLRAKGHYPTLYRKDLVALVAAERAYCVELVEKVEAQIRERQKLSRAQALAKQRAKRRERSGG